MPEQHAGERRADRERGERDQHHMRRFVRRVVVAMPVIVVPVIVLAVRGGGQGGRPVAAMAEEGHEHQAPGIERGQRGGYDDAEEGVDRAEPCEA